MAKRVVKKKAGANGYKLPDPLPKGEILIDIAKKKWKLGESIGQGGFGEIYAAQEAESKGSKYPYVVKIEPHENGPLFVEINFYIRNAKSQDVEEFKAKKKLKSIGMPTYIGSGSHEHNNQKYRFLVMHKFGSDIWKLFLEEKMFPTATVFKLAVQILDVLEYIHERGYVHADVKGANILLGLDKEAQNQVYLVDFGLATKYQSGTEFKPNPKKAHDGTIEYLSRDAHHGVATRRGDLEILAYNMVQWLGCTLPWEKLKIPAKVQESKEENMSDTGKFLKQCFGTKNIPGSLSKYFKIIETFNKENFDSKPDYLAIRKLFITEIEDSGDKLTTTFMFKNNELNKRTNTNEKGSVKRQKKNAVDNENEELSEERGTKKAKETNDKDEEAHKVVKTIRTTKTVEKNDSKDAPKVRKTKKPAEQEKEPDKFQGYTAEMKALAMKKVQNNTNKKSKPKTNGEVEKRTETELASDSKTVRVRRNIKVVNYKESL